MINILCKTLVALVLSLVLFLTAQAPDSIPSSAFGTLIVFIPTNDGLIVAADSRSNVRLDSADQTVHCDDANKIAILKHHERTVVAIGGTDKSYYFTSPRAVRGDTCGYLRSVLPVLNSTELVSTYLDEHNGDIDKNMMLGLRAYYLRKVRAVQRRYPSLLSDSKGENGLATVAVGEYQASRHISVFASFRICISASVAAVVCEEKWHEYRDSDECRVEVVGETQFVQEQVLNDTGARLLGYRHLRDYASFFTSKVIGNAQINRGKDAAIDLLQSSEILSERIGSRTIGGPIRVVQMDQLHAQPFFVQ